MSIATPAHFCALTCKKLDPGQSINANALCDLIQLTLHTRKLKSQNFIAYISDNCSYAKKAFKLLQVAHPHLRRIGCLSHIVHLLSKAIFSPSKNVITWPVIDVLVSDTNTLFATRHAALERERQDRFHRAFDNAARPLFWQVTGRWACKLKTLLWLNEHRVQFVLFLNNELEHYNTNLSLELIRDALLLKSTLVQLNLVCQLASPLLTFLRLTQTENAALSAGIFQSYDAFISGIEAANSPEYLGMLINKACNDNLVVLSIEARAASIYGSLPCTGCASEAKHTGRCSGQTTGQSSPSLLHRPFVCLLYVLASLVWNVSSKCSVLFKSHSAKT